MENGTTAQATAVKMNDMTKDPGIHIYSLTIKSWAPLGSDSTSHPTAQLQGSNRKWIHHSTFAVKTEITEANKKIQTKWLTLTRPPKYWDNNI